MIRPILVATDFSPRSDRALRRATMLAKLTGAGLSLVHVVDDDQPAHLVASQIEASRAILAESIRTVEAFDGISAAASVVAGDAYSGILAAADEIGAGVIVLGPHRRQLRDLFVGTTAERVVAHSRRPVLVVAGLPSAPYTRALAAFDLEEGSRPVARRLREIEALGASEIVAIHAFDAAARGMMRRAMSGADAIDDYMRDEGRRASEDFRRLLAGTGLAATRHRSVPMDGKPARTISRCASGEEADLIVVGTGQRTGIERLLLGSVAREVLGEADRDVLVIPNGPDPDRRSPGTV